ncbi:MAG: HIT domain-containing protein [Myxococcales bacterium]|jgi:histidine triad (HIT) family protein|nr:HIT domain-containing protein [Myxococcales bacterium]
MTTNDCLFCRIRDGQIPSPKLFEDDVCFAIADIAPQAPTHLLILPKQHIASLDALKGDEEVQIVGHLLAVAARLARAHGFADNGYRAVINCNTHGGQTVFHLHVHLLGGRQMGWPPG